MILHCNNSEVQSRYNEYISCSFHHIMGYNSRTIALRGIDILLSTLVDLFKTEQSQDFSARFEKTKT